jgi:hypothetical protein
MSIAMIVIVKVINNMILTIAIRKLIATVAYGWFNTIRITVKLICDRVCVHSTLSWGSAALAEGQSSKIKKRETKPRQTDT